MKLDELIEKIKQETEEECAKIIQRARREAELEVELAREEAEKILQQARKEAEIIKNKELARRISKIKQETRKAIFKEAAYLAKEAVQRLKKDIYRLIEKKDYPQILKKLAKKALEELGIKPSEAVVEVSEKDVDIIKQMLAGATIKKNKKLKGGIVVKSQSGVMVDYSLEALAELIIPTMYSLVFKEVEELL